MTAMSYEHIKAKIKDATNISEADIDLKVNDKLKQLSDLISKEGAAHIVANDLGVKIFQPMKQGRMKVSELIPMQRNVEVLVRVVKNYGIRNFKTEKKEGRNAAFLAGDESGIIRTTVWDEPVIKQLETVKENDIVLIKGAYIRENNGYKELHLGTGSSVALNPANETVGFSRAQPANKSIAELKDKDMAIIAGTIVQLFEPKFYEACTICSKKVIDGACPNHGKVEKRMIPIVNVILDDGTDNIRVVCFRDAAESMLGKDADTLAKVKDNPGIFEEIKKNILGKQVQVTGKINMNDMFARLEMVANSVKEATPAEVIATVKHEEFIA
ncbi:MAG: hypothetical protein V1734_01310 [Nanoarchaeota archaeon]